MQMQWQCHHQRCWWRSVCGYMCAMCGIALACVWELVSYWRWTIYTNLVAWPCRLCALHMLPALRAGQDTSEKNPSDKIKKSGDTQNFIRKLNDNNSCTLEHHRKNTHRQRDAGKHANTERIWTKSLHHGNLAFCLRLYVSLSLSLLLYTTSVSCSPSGLVEVFPFCYFGPSSELHHVYVVSVTNCSMQAHTAYVCAIRPRPLHVLHRGQI